jgi:anti-sigma factor ChrR (cupin superfamily)
MTTIGVTECSLDVMGRDLVLEATVRALAADTELWTPLVRFTEPRARIPLPSEPGIEVRLLTWSPGQGSGLHDHGGSSGCFMVLRGTVSETIVEHNGHAHEFTHSSGHIGSFDRDIIHDVRNDEDEGAVTLHAYRPALTNTTEYVLENGTLRAASTHVWDADA